MSVASSMRYSSGYTIITLTGYGALNLTIPASSYHYTLIGGGGMGALGATSTHGGGGGAGGVVSGWSTIKWDSNLIHCYVGEGESTSSVICDTYINEPVHGLEYVARAYRGLSGDSVSTGTGGNLYNSTHVGGAPNDVCAGGGAGWGEDGSAAPSTEQGGNGGDGVLVEFFDYSTWMSAGGAGSGTSLSGSGGRGGGGQGGFLDHAATSGEDGTGSGGGGGATASAQSAFGIGSNSYNGSPIGGGYGYAEIFTTGDYTVTTLGDLNTAIAAITALRAASDYTPKIIYLHPNANINMGNSQIVVPSYTTICSRRGNDAGTTPTTAWSAGAWGRVYTKSEDDGSGTYHYPKPVFIINGDNVRFAGFTLEGECFAEDADGDESVYRVGIMNRDGHIGFQVDNMDLYGWAWACVYNYGSPTQSPLSAGAWFHHNYAHHCQNKNEGYGFNVEGGDMLVEGNLFDYNRHSITGAGFVGERYTARYNHVVGNGFIHYGTHFDVHKNESGSDTYSGTNYQIYNNTFDNCATCAAGNCMCAIGVQGTARLINIYNNEFNADWGSGANFEGVTTPCFTNGTLTPTNIICTNNMVKGVLKTGQSGVIVQA